MGATFRKNKQLLREWFQDINWIEQKPLPSQCFEVPEMEIINPLFACLPQGGLMTQRAAYCLGILVASLYEKNKEQAQICIRRFMWHMNEESGNIGWGIPEAFGQCLAKCPPLAKIYHNVLISYVHDIAADSNFCDYAPLRVSCYDGIYMLGKALPEYQERICFVLNASKEDDFTCRVKLSKILKEFESV